MTDSGKKSPSNTTGDNMATTLTPDVQQALLAILNDIQSAKDFVLAETPQVLQQMMGWHATSSWFGIAAGILLLIVGAATGVFASKASRECNYNGVCLGSLIAFIALFSGVFALVVNAIAIIKIAHYPKWYLVETLTRMLS